MVEASEKTGVPEAAVEAACRAIYHPEAPASTLERDRMRSAVRAALPYLTLPAPDAAAVREAHSAEENHLQEIADGAYGDGPLTRGRARDELAARAALKGNPSPQAGTATTTPPYAFITCESGNGKYQVVIKTKTLQDAQDWHGAVLALANPSSPSPDTASNGEASK